MIFLIPNVNIFHPPYEPDEIRDVYIYEEPWTQLLKKDWQLFWPNLKLHIDELITRWLKTPAMK